MIKKKYRALRFVAFVCQVLAWVSLVLSILAAIGSIGVGLTGYISVPALERLFVANIVSLIAGVGSAIGIIVFGIINFVVLLATAEYLYVVIDTEQNTRISAEYLRQLLLTQQPAQPVEQIIPVAAVAPVAVVTTASSTQHPVETFPAEPTVTTTSAPLTKE